MVADIEQRLGGVAIDKLDAEYVGFGECGLDLDLEVARANVRRVSIVLRDVVLINFNNLGLLTVNQYAVVFRARSCGLYLNVWVVGVEDLTDDATDWQQGDSEKAEKGLHRGIAGLLSFERESLMANGDTLRKGARVR